MKHPPDDPVFLHARREAVVIVALFGVMLVWSLCVSVGLGYVSGDETIKVARFAGMPAWVFWGILVPWIVVDLIAVWFCFFYMTDDDLGEEAADDLESGA